MYIYMNKIDLDKHVECMQTLAVSMIQRGVEKHMAKWDLTELTLNSIKAELNESRIALEAKEPPSSPLFSAERTYPD